MWVFAIFVAVSVFVFIAGYRLISSAPDDPPPPDFNGDVSKPTALASESPVAAAHPARAATSEALLTGSPRGELAIHYNRFLATFLFVCSLLILGASLLAGVSLNSITGLILLFVSVAYFVQPALVVTGSAVQHRNVLGMTMRTTPFTSLSDITFEDGNVWVKQEQERVKVIGVRFLYSSGDIAKLQERVRQFES